MSVRKLTITSLTSAISFLLLYASCIVPTGKIALFCVASACLCVVVMECGRAAALLGAVVIGLLGFFFFPNKFVFVAFAAFFGYYPVAKSLLERSPSLVMEWIGKILFYCAVIFITVCVLVGIGMITRFPIFGYPIVAGICVIYDIALSMIIAFYARRIMPHTGRHEK